MKKKKVAILGAGFTGLTAAYELTKRKDLEVFVFEKEETPGGLASGFKRKNWQWTVEATYHHLFTSDHFAKKLSSELNLPIIFKRPVTASYTHGSIVPLDSPLNLLFYPYLNLQDKLRTGLLLAFLKLNPFWKPLEKQTAKNWLIRLQGLNPWTELWEPLFIGKFGKYADKIAASWFWARIKKRSPQLGFPQGGFQVFANKLAEKIQEQGGKIFYNSEVQEVFFDGKTWKVKIKNNKPSEFSIFPGRRQAGNFQFSISTLPTPIFIKVTPQLPQEYVKKLSSIAHLDALSLVLELKKPFLPLLKNTSEESWLLRPRRISLPPSEVSRRPYWLNIHDTSFPFLAVVEHTNFMDKKYYGGNHLLYVGNYLPRNHKFFKMTKEELLKLFKPFLLKINPSYNLPARNATHSARLPGLARPSGQVAGGQPITYNLFTAPFAQPVITTNYPKLRPQLVTPLPNLYLGNLDCVYPWDRGINYAIELGQKLVNCVKIFL